MKTAMEEQDRGRGGNGETATAAGGVPAGKDSRPPAARPGGWNKAWESWARREVREFATRQSAGLWSVRDLAVYLCRSERWVRARLGRSEQEPGSIPHLRLGKKYRFDPDTIRAWAELGCPPVATFRAMVGRARD